VAHEAEWAGSPYFDHLLGMAALDSGRPVEAIFCLQRVLAAEPAFFAPEWNWRGLSSRPVSWRPTHAVRLPADPIATRSHALSSSATCGRSMLAGGRRARESYLLVEAGAGCDSNANGSTGEQNFLGFTLDPDNVETSSPFVEPAAGLGHLRPLGETAAWVNTARLSHRFNPDADFVDRDHRQSRQRLNWTRDRNRAVPA
jgi:hypothetical protein